MAAAAWNRHERISPCGDARAFDFALAEASLHRDVLQARAGLLRDYDTLVKAVVAMEDAVTRLRSYAQTEGLTPAPGQRLNSARRLRAACARPTSYNRNTITDS